MQVLRHRYPPSTDIPRIPGGCQATIARWSVFSNGESRGWRSTVEGWLSLRGSCYHYREREDPGMGTTRKYVVIDAAAGKIDRRIFSDQAIYDDEMEKIFGRAWLMIGHDSLVPEIDDFFHTYMGEDPVILTRDGEGRLHALLMPPPRQPRVPR
jgi:hypothetical protein